MMRRFVLAILAGLAASPAAATDFEPQLEGLISAYIRPQTAEFAATAARLPATVSAVCEEPSEDNASAFKAAYGETLSGFARIQFLRFGPLLDNDRLSRLAFLPDPRGITQRQLRKIYAEKDLPAAGGLADKSVAVQGLTALELIAFSKDSKVELGAPDKDRDFTCVYALAISRNIADIGAKLAADWADPDGYSSVLLSAGEQNDRFKTSKEALESVFNTLMTGLIIARDQDILPALGASKEKAKARRLPFSRSGNSVLYLSGELEGLRQALASLDLKGLTPEEFQWIYNTLEFEFANAQSLLDQLDPPLRQSFGEDGSYDKVAVLSITLKSIRDTMALELAGALDLAGGFNALDGD